MNLTRGTNTAYYIIFSHGEGVSDPSQSQCVCFPFSIDISFLNKSVNNGTLFPPAVPFLLLFTVNMSASRCVYGKRETGAKREEARSCSASLSPVQAKNTPLRALPLRSLLRAPSPFLFHFVPSSSLFLDLRSTRLPRSQSS